MSEDMTFCNSWIPVKDRLPDTEGYYLVTEKHSYGTI